jgi:hypothetical protein
MTTKQRDAGSPESAGRDTGSGHDTDGWPATADEQAAWDQVVARTEAVRRWLLDWEQWRHGETAAAAVRRWRAQHECLAGCSSVDDIVAVCGRDRRIAQETADAHLAILVGEAVRGDCAAARVVLQRVLPALVSQAARRAAQLGRPFDELLHELTTSAWLVIVSYPVDRRPIKVAVNVARDADYRLFGYTRLAERPGRIVPVEPCVVDRLADSRAQLDGRPLGEPKLVAVELLEFLAYAVARGFPRSQAQLLAELVVLGLPVPDVARKHGVAPRTMRRHRLEALRELAAWGAVALPPQPAVLPAPAAHDRGGPPDRTAPEAA